MPEQPTQISPTPNYRSVKLIGLGFLLIVFVMGALVALGLNRMRDLHNELETFIGQHNVKIEQVQVMRHVIRERMIRMQQLVIEDDPFKRDEIITGFYSLANQFVKAREELEALPRKPEESQLLNTLRDLTSWATPFHESVVELLGKDQHMQARRLLLEQSLPAQRKVMEQCDRILEYYKEAASQVETQAHSKYEKSTFAMIMLGGLAASISFITALTVMTKVKEDRDALQAARDGLEHQVAKRTAELRESVGRLAEAQRVSHIGHWEWDIEHDVMHWSDEVYRILGLPPQSLQPTYAGLQHATHPDDRERFTVAIDKVLIDQVPFNFDHRIVRPNGIEHIVHQQAKVDFDENGKLLRMLGTMQDVTEVRTAEQKLRLAASVFQNAGEGILITDADNNIIDINDAFTEITGYKRDEVLGKNPAMFKSGKHAPSFYREMWNSLLETNQWRGEIWGLKKSGVIFPKWQTINTIRDENGKITHFLAIFRDISDAKKHEESLWKLAHYDNLCGVANRSLMYANLRQFIAHAMREKHSVAFMLFDLDHFKQINDTLGHDAGDQLLVHVSQQLKDTVRDCDTVARLGGDEFVVLLDRIHRKEDVEAVVRKIQHALGASLTLRNGEVISIGASIGMALYPADAADIETLMKNADRAMYYAKELGRNNAQFFREGMCEETRPESPTT